LIFFWHFVDLVINPDDYLIGEAHVYLSQVDMEDVILLHGLADKELSTAVKENNFIAFLE